jgi:hypothetical protein
MKITEFRKLIREEVRKVVNEVDYPQESYAHMKPFAEELARSLKALYMLYDKIEQKGPTSEELADALDALESLSSRIKNQK